MPRFEKNRPQDRLPYIDGLRAIAILSVLVYHLKLGIAPNGFLGVDVFFAISGFVVCRSLAKAASDGHPPLFSYLEHFYRRRFWRLVPALAAMIAVTLALVHFFVPPAYLSRLIVFTAAGAAGGVANIVLALASNTNYFDQMSGYNPFLHTWSLGVEEQFYVIFPLLLWGLWLRPQARRFTRVFLPVLALASFGLAVWQSSANPTHAFNLLPARFWELAAGALAYLIFERAQRRLPGGTLVAWTGIALILLSVFWPVELASPFPGGIPAVAGAVLVLLCAAKQEGWNSPNRWLSARGMVYVGRISYSLYLWHWPVIVLMRWTIGDQQTWEIVLALIASFLLAIVSYHWIEQPFQRMAMARRVMGAKFFAAAITSVVAFSVAVLAVGKTHDYTFLHFASRSIVNKAPGWMVEDMPGIASQPSADLAEKRPALFIVGDSHAGHLKGAATVAARDAGLGLSILSCAFTLQMPAADNAACLAPLAGARAGDVVLFSSLYLPRYVDQDGHPQPEPDFDNPKAIAQRQAALAQMTSIIGNLTSRGVAVVIRGPEPLFHFIAFRCSDWFNRMNPICDVPKSEPRSTLLARAQPATDSIAALQKRFPGVTVWDVFDVLCPGRECSVYDADGHPLFFDQDHLSGWGNALLLPSLKKTLQAVLAASAR